VNSVQPNEALTPPDSTEGDTRQPQATSAAGAPAVSDAPVMEPAQLPTPRATAPTLRATPQANPEF
jgi:hypothetical protein